MMKYNILCLILVLGVIFSVSSVCATDLNETQLIPTDDSIQITHDTQAIPTDDSIQITNEESVPGESPDDSIELANEDTDMDEYDYNFTPIYKGGPFELPSDEIDMDEGAEYSIKNLPIEKNDLTKGQYDFTPISLVYVFPEPVMCPLTIVLRDCDGSRSHNSNISLSVIKPKIEGNTISAPIVWQDSMLTNKKGDATLPIPLGHNQTTVSFQVVISFHDSDWKYIVCGQILNATKGGKIWVSCPSDKNGCYLIDKKEGVHISMYGEY